MFSSKVMRMLLFSSAMLAGFTYTQLANAGSCPQEGAKSCSSGYLCFIEWKNNKCGKVYGTNSNWTDFGWNDRAEYFYNNGNSYDVCIYEHAGYNPGFWGRFAGKTLIKRGDYNSAYFGVSANRWTSQSSCRRG